MTAVQKGNARGSGYDRASNDWYVESPAAVRALLDAERFWGWIVDPACGAGNIPKTCTEAGLSCSGSDIADRGYGATCVDYLDAPYKSVDCIITNPPYDLAEQFALKAIGEAKHKVALLVRLAWLEGMGRYDRLFKPHPPSRILVFRNRISCPPGGVDMPAKGGAVAYCWIIWSSEHRGPTQTDWIKA